LSTKNKKVMKSAAPFLFVLKKGDATPPHPQKATLEKFASKNERPVVHLCLNL
jgi:hypothetical protein